MPLGEMMENFHFIRPAWGLLLLPPLTALVMQWRQGRRDDAWDEIIAPHLLAALRLRQFRYRLFSPVNVAAALMVLMTFIAMGPSWRQQPSPLARDEAALIVLLDTSGSMQARDIQPSRLVRARQKIADLLALRGGSRTALVVYAGSAHTVLDLTDDADILRQYLAAIDPDIMPRTGKFAEYALPMVDRIIGDSTAPTTVLLMTDGASTATAGAFSDWFDSRPHQLLVLGVGTEDPGGNAAPLETRALKELAGDSGGRFLEITVDDRDMRTVARLVEAHYVITEDSSVPWLDSGYWLVFPCLALFILWFRRGWTLQWCLAGCLLLGQSPQASAQEHWFADLWLTADQQGRLLLERGDYTGAATRFRDPFWKGLAHYYAEEFDLAAEYFSRIDSPAARFNQANALAHGEHYLRAVAIYDELLEDEPGHRPAAHNRQVVQELIDAINAMSESQAATLATGARAAQRRGHPPGRENQRDVDAQRPAQPVPLPVSEIQHAARAAPGGTLMRFLSLLLLLALPASAGTLDSLLAEDRLRVASWLEPAEEIVVGQEVRLVIEVSTPRWFAGGTRIGAPEIDGLVVLRRNEFALNLSRREAGDTWVVQRWELELYPQRSGEFALPPIQLELAVNDAEAGILRGQVQTEPLAFRVQLPAAMAGSGSWLATPSLSIRQRVDRDPANLVPGDAFTRVLEIEATYVTAMMLPEPDLSAPEGIAAYPAIPELENRSNRGEATAIRRQAVTYVVERAGQYRLPALSLTWWNTETRQRETTVLPELEIDAGAATPLASGTGLPAWFWPALVSASLLCIAALLARRRQRRADPLKEARRALGRGDAPAATRALYGWLNQKPGSSDWLSLRQTAAAVGEAKAADKLLAASYGESEKDSAGAVSLLRKLRWIRRPSGRHSAPAAISLQPRK